MNDDRITVHPAWDVAKAQAVLDTHRHYLAERGGVSDRSMGRLAALSEPFAAATRESFEDALERGGLSKKKIVTALTLVERQELAEVRPTGPSKWTIAALLVERAYFETHRYLLLHSVAYIVWHPLVVLSLLVHLGARVTGEVVRARRPPEPR